MPIRTIATLAIAVLLGLVAVFLVRNYLASARAPAAQAAAAAAAGSVPVVVASAPIERGKVIEGAQLKVARYPADAIPPGAFQNLTDLTGAAADKRVALRSIGVNEPVLADRISGPGGRLTLSSTLTLGMRAVSLRSNDVAGVAGFVLPGDRVDILLTRTVNNIAVTQVLAENVRVLGVDQTASDETDKPQVARAVTVEVTPDQAQSVSLAQTVGAVSFALRHGADAVPLVRRVTTVADLGYFKGGPAAATVARPVRVARRGTEVHVIRGVETVGYNIP